MSELLFEREFELPPLDPDQLSAGKNLPKLPSMADRVKGRRQDVLPPKVSSNSPSNIYIPCTPNRKDSKNIDRVRVRGITVISKAAATTYTHVSDSKGPSGKSTKRNRAHTVVSKSSSMSFTPTSVSNSASVKNRNRCRNNTVVPKSSSMSYANTSMWNSASVKNKNRCRNSTVVPKSSVSANNSNRHVFVEHELEVLEKAYKSNTYPIIPRFPEIEKIAEQLRISEVKVLNWFYNRRRKEKKKRLDEEPTWSSRCVTSSPTKNSGVRKLKNGKSKISISQDRNGKQDGDENTGATSPQNIIPYLTRTARKKLERVIGSPLVLDDSVVCLTPINEKVPALKRKAIPATPIKEEIIYEEYEAAACAGDCVDAETDRKWPANGDRSLETKSERARKKIADRSTAREKFEPLQDESTKIQFIRQYLDEEFRASKLSSIIFEVVKHADGELVDDIFILAKENMASIPPVEDAQPIIEFPSEEVAIPQSGPIPSTQVEEATVPSTSRGQTGIGGYESQIGYTASYVDMNGYTSIPPSTSSIFAQNLQYYFPGYTYTTISQPLFRPG